MIISLLFSCTIKWLDYIERRWQVNEWACGIGGIILTRENRSTRRKTCLSAALTTTNPTWTGLILHLGLHEERRATDRLRFGSKWRSVLRHTTQPLYHLGHRTRYQSDGSLDGSEIRSGRHWEQKIWTYRESNPDSTETHNATAKPPGT